MESEFNRKNRGNYMEDDLQYLKMLTKDCNRNEIREMFKGDFNNNTDEIPVDVIEVDSRLVVL